MDEFKAMKLPFKYIPSGTIVGDFGVCTKCFSYWTKECGCSNPKCPEIVYREIEDKNNE